MCIGKKISVLQTTRNLIESVQQIILISLSPHDVINPGLAVQASQQLGHHTLEAGRRVENALGHTRGDKQTFGGGDEHFLGFGRQRHLPLSLQHFKPKCYPRQVGHLRLWVRHDTYCLLNLLVNRAVVTHQASG